MTISFSRLMPIMVLTLMLVMVSACEDSPRQLLHSALMYKPYPGGRPDRHYGHTMYANRAHLGTFYADEKASSPSTAISIPNLIQLPKHGSFNITTTRDGFCVGQDRSISRRSDKSKSGICIYYTPEPGFLGTDKIIFEYPGWNGKTTKFLEQFYVEKPEIPYNSGHSH